MGKLIQSPELMIVTSGFLKTRLRDNCVSYFENQIMQNVLLRILICAGYWESII